MQFCEKAVETVQSYLRKARLSTLLDDVGLRLLLMVLGLGWFIYLWGVGVPALLAGLSLGTLGQMGLNQFRRHTVDRREKSLRCRLGGELMLEDMLLAPVRQAHFQAALLLGAKYPLTMERVTEDGMLCHNGKERLLVSCIPLPEGAEVSQSAIAGVQRACRQHGVKRGVACTTGRVSSRTEAWAVEGCIPVRIIKRETLVRLAGAMSPATDQQLVALGQRKKHLVPGGARWALLRRDKAKTYLLYGLGLMVMYILTGMKYYPVPGGVCLVLAALCRAWPEKEEQL